MSGRPVSVAAHCWSHVPCRRVDRHQPHTHIGSCGLPEWCEGDPPADGTEHAAAGQGEDRA